MRSLLCAAVLVSAVFSAIPANAQTRAQIQEECVRLSAGHSYREATRTGVTRQQWIQRCVRRKLAAVKGR